MNTINICQVLGMVGKDPILSYNDNGNPGCVFSVATKHGYKDSRTGKWEESTEWHRVVVWGRDAEFVAEYLHKGDAVYVSGRAQTSRYKKDGEDRTSRQIIADKVIPLGRRVKSASDRGFTPHKGHDERASGRAEADSQPDSPSDDDIPF